MKKNITLFTTPRAEPYNNVFIDYLSFLKENYDLKIHTISDMSGIINNEEIKSTDLLIVDVELFYKKGNYEAINEILKKKWKGIFIDLCEKKLTYPFFIDHLLKNASDNNFSAVYFMYDKLPSSLAVGSWLIDEETQTKIKERFKKEILTLVEIVLRENDTKSMLDEALKHIKSTHYQFSKYKA